MKILLLFSLLTILVALFPVGLLFSFLAKKLAQSERGLWLYCKALLLVALAVFLSVYWSTLGFFKTYPMMVVMLIPLVITLTLVGLFFQKGWHRYEKIATISWGLLAFFVIIFLSLNFSIFYPFVISDNGMAPVYSKNDFVFCQTNKILDKRYSKGDVVTLRNPNDKNKTIIRKIVAEAGDKVEIKNEQLFVNNQAIKAVKANEPIAPLALGAGQYFVLAENSKNVFDSRSFSPTTKADIYAKVMFKLNWLRKLENF